MDHYSKPMHIHPLMEWENTKPESCIFGIHECVLWERIMQGKSCNLFWFRFGVNGQMGRLDYSD